MSTRQLRDDSDLECILNADKMSDKARLSDNTLRNLDRDDDMTDESSFRASCDNEDVSHKDHGWAWVICGAAFLDLFIVLGMHYSFGVLYTALLDHFGETKATTAWVGSIGQFSLFFFCYTSSVLSKRYGCRRVVMLGGLLTSLGLLLTSFMNDIRMVYITHGLIFGLGTSISYLPALVMVGQYFEKKRSLATGLAASGSNLGALSLAPLQQTLVTNYGWRNCYRALAGLSLLIIACGAMFKPFPEKKASLELNGASLDLVKLQRKKKKTLGFPKNSRFIIWAIASTIAVFGYFIPHTNLVFCAEEMGYSYSKGSLLLSYVGFGSGVGKIFFGKISDLPYVNTFILYKICMVLSGLSAMIVILATNYQMLVSYSLVFGFLDGSFIGLMSIVTFDCADPKYMFQAWGGVLMIESFAMLVGPPIAGWLGDATGNYKNVFYFAGGPMILGAIIFSLIWWVKDPVLQHHRRPTQAISFADVCGELVIYEKLTVV